MRGLKGIVSTCLLLFIAVSVVYLSVAGRGESEDRSAAAGEPRAVCVLGEECAGDSGDVLNGGATVVAYYFHRSARCPSCRTLESSAREAIDEKFVEDLGKGALLIKSINLDEAANRHFVEHYGVTGPAWVLSKMEGSKEVAWKNLDQIWSLVRRPVDYKQYVVAELQNFIGERS